MSEHVEIRWVKVGIAGGIAASALYPVLAVRTVPSSRQRSRCVLPRAGDRPRNWRLSPHQTPRAVCGGFPWCGAQHHRRCPLHGDGAGPVGCSRSSSYGAADLVGVWLGLDLAWDIYIGLGTLAFGCAMPAASRFGWPLAGVGMLLGFLVIVLNPCRFRLPRRAPGCLTSAR